jgi:aspartate-semialdehyde dehydrogenase
VPVFTGHSEAVHVEFTRPMSPGEARRILAEAPGVRLLDDPATGVYPQPLPSAGTDDTYVGRIREDSSLPGGLAMWIVSDNLRKGAALNAIQIAEAMAERGWLPRGADNG